MKICYICQQPVDDPTNLLNGEPVHEQCRAMSKLTLYRKDDGVREVTIEDPSYVDVLFNTQQVAVDGEIYDNVTQVRMETND
jgi:hypothetical protein